MSVFGTLQRAAVAIWPWGRGSSALQLGEHLLAEGKVREALGAFLRHAGEHPAEAADAYCRAAKCCLHVKHRDLPREVFHGVAIAVESSRDAAENLFRKALAHKPRHFESLLGLADVLPPRSPERLHVLERAANLQPHYPTLLAIGDFYRDVLAEMVRAYEYYQKAQQQAPRDKAAYQRLGDLCRRLGRESDAQHWQHAWNEVAGRRNDPSRG